jgi:glycosyl hydrolase family 26
LRVNRSRAAISGAAVVVIAAIVAAFLIVGNGASTGSGGGAGRPAAGAGPHRATATLPAQPGHRTSAPPPARPAARGHGHPDADSAVPQDTPAGVNWVLDAKSWRIHRFIGVAPRSPVLHNTASFAGITHLHPAVIEMYTGFNNRFPGKQLSQIFHYGSVPLVQWNPRGASLKNIQHGKFDGYIRRFAKKMKAFGHPVILSFGHEMNGHWSRWSPPFATAGQFVASWRRIHTIFARNHVSNVLWSWDPSHTTSAKKWWPGSVYVDRIGIDGYFRSGQSFKKIFGKALAAIRRYANKPVYIAETSVQRGHGQVQQVENIFHGVRRYHLSGFVWFDINRLETWRLEGRHPAIRAFRRCTTPNTRCA